jgi:hypothetical protein
MLDNKHPYNIGPSYQLKDGTGESKERIEETTST